MNTAHTLSQAEMAAHDVITWKLYEACAKAEARVSQHRELVRKIEAGARGYGHHNLDLRRGQLAEAEVALQTAVAALDSHEKAYTGWARFWCVPGGHIHSSRRCSTCNRNGKATSFFLASEVSGMDEAAAVAAQGPVLCTVCFPTAPLDWTNGLDEAAKAKKAAQCPGSGTYLDKSLPHRTGYYTGNWATCPSCAQHITITSTWKLRAHKPA
jgi:hypothetical protein